ncbi:hypothetical protein ABT008_23745 [Micromonospora sp. NPDC002389]|uniref:hypothetical protein n=1 Tax=Micromonospora sp. NPDC002389 TaxID=3154272 RepID=UPI00332FB0AF
MGERGDLTRYAYWSERRVRSIAEDGGIDLSPRWRSKLAVSVPLLNSTAEFEREPRGLFRNEIADRIERAIGDLAVEDFVTPPRVRFAKGRGQVEFTHLTGCRPPRVVVGVRSVASDGSRVAVCLFGSTDNLAGFVSAGEQYVGAGSGASSSGSSISSWLVSGFPEDRSEPIDAQSISREAVAVAFDNGPGDGGPSRRDREQPEFSFDQVTDSEWFAEIYSDVVLVPDSWTGRTSVDRVLIGAPLWVRTPRGRADRRRAMNATGD